MSDKIKKSSNEQEKRVNSHLGISSFYFLFGSDKPLFSQKNKPLNRYLSQSHSRWVFACMHSHSISLLILRTCLGKINVALG